MFENLYHVIMAGGSGTRFWPASRRDRPKQFLALAGAGPLLRQTFDRCAACGPADRIFVSAGEEHRRGTAAILPELPASRFIAEPVARNTAPAVGLSAMTLFLIDPDAIAVFCPADHVFADLPAYRAAVDRAVAAAASGDLLVTLGITPTRPETGYGYIEAGPPAGVPGVLAAERFIEKPDARTARELAGSGRHYWNSGVFVWRVASILASIGRHHRALAEDLTRYRKAVRAAIPQGPVADPLAAPGAAAEVAGIFGRQASISIDYAVMEKAPNVVVVPCDPGWSDVGSWDAVAGIAPPDAEGNVLRGEILATGSARVFASGSGRLVALVGVEDLIVVDTGDALLVCRRGDSQRVREIVARLEAAGRSDLL